MTASFAERVEQYIAMRRGLGYRLARQATYLQLRGVLGPLRARRSRSGRAHRAVGDRYPLARSAQSRPAAVGRQRGFCAISRRWTGR